MRLAGVVGRGRIAPAWLVFAAGALDLLLWGGNGVTRLGGSAPVILLAGAGALLASLCLPRGRWRSAYAVCWAGGIALAAVFPAYQPFAVLLAVLYRIVRTQPGRTAAPYVAATAMPWGVNTASAAANLGSDAGGVAVTFTLWCVITALVVLAGRFGRTHDELLATREAVVAARARAAVQEERLHLAREIHDVVSHSVGAVLLQAAGARRVVQDPEAVGAALAGIESASSQAMGELRQVLSVLRDGDAGATGEDAREPWRPLVDPAAMGRLLATAEASGVSVDVSQAGIPTPERLSAEVDLAAYRVLQEALTNVMRHGGAGSAAHIHVDWTGPEGFGVEVRSRSGTTPPHVPVGGHGGRGLAGLAERVARVGGTVTSGPIEGGYRLRARLPWSAAPAEAAGVHAADGAAGVGRAGRPARRRLLPMARDGAVSRRA